jgi:hypothetical protein
MAWLPLVAVYWSPLNLLLKIVVAYLSHKSSEKQKRRNGMTQHWNQTHGYQDTRDSIILLIHHGNNSILTPTK